MKSKKRLNIGFFTCHLDNDYAYEVCKGVDYAAKELDVNLVVFPGMYMNASYNDPKNARFDYQYNSIFYYASKHTLDALVVAIGSIGTFLSENDMISFLGNFDIPILTIEIEVPGYSCLYTEGKSGMREAIEHIIKIHGKTQIGYVSGRKENADAEERLSVYRKVLEENNIPVEDKKIVYGNFSEYTEELVDELLDNNPGLEAIVFANDQMAIGGYNAIKKRGLVIGRDILVTGYDDAPVSMVLDPPLTTVHNSIIDMGYHSIYEAIKLAETGKMSHNVLNSSLIERGSCGCNDFKLEEFVKSGFKYTKETPIEEIIIRADEYLYSDYKRSFFYDELLAKCNKMLRLLIEPLLKNEVPVFDKDAITNYLNELFNSDLLTQYFSRDKFTYSLKQLRSILLTIIDDQKSREEILEVFSIILDRMYFNTSSTLYNSIREHKSTIWQSMYITRDTLTYSDDEEACFKLIMEKLIGNGFISSSIYIYDDPIILLPNGSWKIPKTLMLQAYHDKDKIGYLSGDNKITSCDDIFNNGYIDPARRKTMVVTPLFTNNIQYGLFIGETDISNFKNIYPTALQLATSLNFITLMKQQLAIQKKLALSATELNNKNELLNKLSITDPLTGINNRRGFLDNVQNIVNLKHNDGQHALVLFADMDNLKQVNDIFGHKNGDFAIKSIARILEDTFEIGDIIGRIGGDEFVAFTFLDDPRKPTELKDKIKELSDKLNETSGKPYYIDISVGLTTFTCSPTLNIEDILHSADEQLYENKKNKRKSVMKV